MKRKYPNLTIGAKLFMVASQSQVGSMITSLNNQKIHQPQHGKWVINNSEIKAIGIAGDTSCVDEVITERLISVFSLQEAVRRLLN